MNAVSPDSTVTIRVEAFLKAAQSVMDNSNLKGHLLTVDLGKRWIRVVDLRGGNAQIGNADILMGSMWAFIDPETGDIFKPASWSRPAKHARANVFDEDYGIHGINQYGPVYLR